jgi:hypothetical protein
MVEVNDVDMTQISGVVGGRYIVHHMELRSGARVGETNQQTEGSNLQANIFDANWPVHEVGRNGDVFDPRAGPILRAGSVMYSSTIHLHSTGQDTTGHMELGFRFHEKGYEPEYQQRPATIGNGVDLSIRPNEDGQQIDAYRVLATPTKIVRFEPHLHAPGKRMCIEAIWGAFRETLNCAGYDHNWVRSYVYEDHAAPLLPAGTILHIYGEMNVSATNINMPETRNWTGSGNRSVSNMFLDLGEFVELTDEQFEREMAERREALDMGPNDHVLGCPLCAAPLVGATRSVEAGVDTGYIVIAGILSSMNRFPSEEDKRALAALANDPTSNRIVTTLAGVVARLEHAPSDADQALMGSVIQRANRLPGEAVAIARAIRDFNGTVTEEDKAALENTMLSTVQ